MRRGGARARVRAVGVVLVSVALAGCGATSDGPLARYRPTGEGGAGALLEGVLTLQDGCLLVVDDVGFTVPVLPSSFDWDATTQAVVGEGVTLRVGDRVSLGGASRQGPYGSVPAACPSDAGYFIAHDVDQGSRGGLPSPDAGAVSSGASARVRG